jgi:hypothetical protein
MTVIAMADFRRARAEVHCRAGHELVNESKAREALTQFLLAVKADPSFAEAYFNCAMALELCADPHTAQFHWRAYLELEPSGVYADIARKHVPKEVHHGSQR